MSPYVYFVSDFFVHNWKVFYCIVAPCDISQNIVLPDFFGVRFLPPDKREYGFSRTMHTAHTCHQKSLMIKSTLMILSCIICSNFGFAEDTLNIFCVVRQPLLRSNVMGNCVKNARKRRRTMSHYSKCEDFTLKFAISYGTEQQHAHKNFPLEQPVQ